jgi:signal transduction histidine kinase
MIEIIVRDEGCGISEENQQKLFRIDQKLVLPGTNGEKGSGMGLTLTKEIIDKHGGQIWFYTQTDEGSEFHLTVPEAKNNVLIVENNDDILIHTKK